MAKVKQKDWDGALPETCGQCPLWFKFYRCQKNYASIQCAIERNKIRKKHGKRTLVLL